MSGRVIPASPLQRHQLLERAAVAGAHVEKDEGAVGVPSGPAGFRIGGGGENRNRGAGGQGHFPRRRGRMSLEHGYLPLEGRKPLSHKGPADTIGNVPEPLCGNSHMAEFDWNDLTSFLAVARSGRLTAAAARLGIDHSTLSRRIAGLEHGLKAKLFDRSPSGYGLTAAGARLLPIAEQMERLAPRAGGNVRGAAARVRGGVPVGARGGVGSRVPLP